MKTTTLLALFASQLLPSTVNAVNNAVSLLSFGPAPLNLPALCTSQYDATINGCSTADFIQGALCSTGCQNALLQAQANLKVACFDVTVSRTTLLGEIFEGEILQALCAPAPAPASTTPNQASTQVSKTTTSKSVATKDTTTSTSTSTSTTDSASSAVPTSPNNAQTVSSATDATDSSSTSSALATASNSAGNVSPPTQTPTLAQAAPKLTSQQIQIKAMDYSGGGSPFDIISSSDADRKTMSSFAAVIVVGAMMMLAR